jgi:hypothetical protein
MLPRMLSTSNASNISVWLTIMMTTLMIESSPSEMEGAHGSSLVEEGAKGISNHQRHCTSLFLIGSLHRSCWKNIKDSRMVHTKLRNRLTSGVCKKLTFIRVNPSLYDGNICDSSSTLAMTDTESITSESANDLENSCWVTLNRSSPWELMRMRSRLGGASGEWSLLNY